MGVGTAPTPPMTRTLRRALERPIRCTAVYPPPGGGETALQCPLQVPWGRTSCLAPCSPVLLPHCGCWACIDPASGSCSLSRPQRTVASSLWVLGPHLHCWWNAHSAAPPVHTGALSDALQCVLCPSGGRPPFNDLYNSHGGALRTSILVPQRYFLVVGDGPELTPPADRTLRRALSARGRLVQCAVAYFLPGRGGSPFNVLYKSPGSLLHALFLTPRCYFLVMGAGPALSPPEDHAPSAHRRFIQCTAACSLLRRDESALQCAPLASAEATGGTVSLCESPVSATAVSPVAPVPAGAPTLRDQTPPCSSGPLVPPGTDSTRLDGPREWAIFKDY
ncbi:hypothetical protein NDU88_004032 [Pleurodeles waltl]|uniref:Uncharacterized protein n=1 Tax=Pleurodeles waltl TaxID=8319 RepID=A0AAV7T6Z0_PLEWA|nr:hypothetical protein NDU88_004032 [Pleurodeles waltl]